ncbi:hypothetical protein NMG60_11021290 [Bertholletia excelsa]
MANNAQFSGMQPIRPPLPLGPPQGAPPSLSMQFRPAGPVPAGPSQQSQPYNPMASQQYQHVGHTNIGLPSHSQFQFSQPVQQLATRPGPGGPGMQPLQAMPIPEMQANRPSMSVSPQPLQSAPIVNSYVAGLGGPRMPLSSSYTFGAPSGIQGQLQRSADTSTHYQSTAQTNLSSFLAGGQPWMLTGSQDMSIGHGQPIGEQSSAVTAAVPAANMEASPIEKLSSDWIEHTSRNGKKYYYNKKTKLSTWEKPLELMTPIERADASTDWKEYKSPEGRKYYYNKVTKQSKWTIPDELKLAREQMKLTYAGGTQLGKGNSPAPAIVAPPIVKASPSGSVTTSSLAQGVVASPIERANVSVVVNSNPVATSEASPTHVVPSTITANVTEAQTNMESVKSDVGGSAETTNALINSIALEISNGDNEAAQDAVNTVDRVSTGDIEEAEKGKESAGKINAVSSGERTIVPEPLVYENKLEAKNAFKALLESANIGSDWTWDQAMRVIINDQRYGALRTLGERKQAFNEFLAQRKKQDAEERRARQKKAQEDFRKMLEESKELISSTRWSKVIAIFEHDERFKAVERAKEREDIFEDYMDELDKKEKAKALEEHKRNRIEYLNFLKSCDFITASSQWRKVQDRLESDERCSRLEKIDRLEIFQEYIRDLEREEEEQMKIRMEELRKSERKNRDEFRKLMEEHVAGGILTAETHWRDYCMKVKDLPAYLAVSSNTLGSTAKDLFQDVSEELQKQYHEDKARIKDAVKFRKIGLSSSWTLEDFKAAILEDISSPHISDINLKLIFDDFLERVKEKEGKEAKRRKRFADDFYDFLSTSKDISARSKWEDCKQVLEDRQESWFTGEESLLREIFEKYIAELKEKAKEKERKRRDDKARRDKDEKDREKAKHKGRGHETKDGKDGHTVTALKKQIIMFPKRTKGLEKIRIRSTGSGTEVLLTIRVWMKVRETGLGTPTGIAVTGKKQSRWIKVAPQSLIVKSGIRDTKKIIGVVLAGMVIMKNLKTGNLVRMGKSGSLFYANKFLILAYSCKYLP